MTVLSDDVGAALLEKDAPFADFAGRRRATNHDWTAGGGLRNSQKGTNRFDGGFGNRLSLKGGSQPTFLPYTL